MKSKLGAFLLCFFLGVFGVHRFYLGKIGTGILYLFTAGLFGIGAFVDLIKIANNSMTDKSGCSLNEDCPNVIPWIGVGLVALIFVIGLFSGIFSTASDVANESTISVEENVEVQDSSRGTNKTQDVKQNTTSKSSKTSTKMSEEEFKKSCKEFNYKEIARSPEKYIGQNFKVEVQIFQTANGGMFADYDKYYKANLKSEDIDSSFGDYYWGDMIFLFDAQDSKSPSYLKILEDDVITAYGTFKGMAETENVLTKTTDETVALYIYYADLIKE